MKFCLISVSSGHFCTQHNQPKLYVSENEYSIECAFWFHHISVEWWAVWLNLIQNLGIYVAIDIDLAQTININETKNYYYAHTYTYTSICTEYSTHVICILIVIQVKSMWKPQWINWMGQIALKFRFNKSLLICQKADGHFFLFFFFSLFFSLSFSLTLTRMCRWGRPLYHIKVYACCDRYRQQRVSTNSSLCNRCGTCTIYMNEKREWMGEWKREKNSLWIPPMS